VPSGAETIVVARPRELFRRRASAVVVGALIPETWLVAFESRTGVDPRLVEEAVYASYPDGFILLFQGPHKAEHVVVGNGNRMNGLERSERRPFVRRTGYLGTRHRDLVALSDHVVLVADGVPLKVRSLLARALTGRWQQETAALVGSDAASLLDEHRGHPATLYVPAPLSLPPGFGTSLLLARERALSASISSEDAQSLDLELTLVGEFPDGSERNFRALLESLAESHFGMALGMDGAARTLRIQVGPGSVRLRMSFVARAVALGLRALFVADIRELLGDEEHQPNPE
jgi:hypothetical protein